MAPKRKPTNEVDNNNLPSSAAADTVTKRATRSSTRLATATVTVTAAPPTTAVPKRKKAKPTPEAEVSEGSSKKIIIEHCKQCTQFKKRAIQVKNGLEKSDVAVNVLVNPEKPRRGCFEIREEGGEIFVSLLDMKRPFTPMKELDMEKVISDIIEKIN
ncbi:hypothetical protein ACJIZ3_008253 [Penstemon smallii]|uniref:Selenoprotein H n=1 Tax=Penstemon smallii TaxID=265156 RepID=A0ABD3T9N0_9LAMI